MERVRYYVEPFDILFLRGNKLFGAPGSFGESLMPPWPSVVAGALRSAMLAARGHDFAASAHGEITSDAELGTPAGPGTFTVTAFDVARRYDDGRIETVHALPADLVVHTVDVQGVERTATRRLTPWPAAEGILSSARTSSLGVLAEPRRGKPATGRWLTATGWTTHLAGRGIDTQQHLVSSADLWTLDTRIGIALDPVQRKAADGALFTSQAVALRKREHATQDTRRGGRAFDVGFLAEVAGATLPDRLTLRFGGDGRAALATLDADGRSPHPDYDAIARTKRCRLILTTPGLFAGGWRPTGVKAGNGDLSFDLLGITGRMVCAAVPRAEVVSGFDVARRCPKPAQRVAPAGSVYWLDDLTATPEMLRRLTDRGLWSDPVENDARRAEGFNRFTFAEWRD